MEEGRSEHFRFFIITFAWSWGVWMIPIILGMGIDNPVAMICLALGGIAPSTTGIILARMKPDRGYWRDFCRRIINVKQIPFLWWLIMILIIPVCSVVALILYRHLTGRTPELATMNKFLSNPFSILPFALFMLFFGPLPEEIGWRGFALDHLEKKYNWVNASLILGFFWMMWHLPLFLIGGTYQHGLMQHSPWLLLDFMIQFYPASIMMDWVYHNTRRSILSGVVFHFFINFFGEFIDMPDDAKYFRTLVQIVIALCILAAWKLRDARSGYSSN